MLATGVAVAVTVLELRYGVESYSLTTTPFTLIGVALGIFFGFRNNAAYDRFWEGRKLWGAQVNTSRTLARQIYSLTRIDGDPSELEHFRRSYVRRVIAFTHALRCHLRDEDPLAEIEPFLSSADLNEVRESRHRPVAILQQLGRDLSIIRSRNWIHELNLPAIDRQLTELSNIMGGCERIKNTPIPFTYSILMHRIVAFYCLALPFGLLDTAGVLTPVVVFLIAHAFFGLDAIGDELENPFGTLANDLPLTAISHTIEDNLLELIGESSRGHPPNPVDGILI